MELFDKLLEKIKKLPDAVREYFMKNPMNDSAKENPVTKMKSIDNLPVAIYNYKNTNKIINDIMWGEIGDIEQYTDLRDMSVNEPGHFDLSINSKTEKIKLYIDNMLMLYDNMKPIKQERTFLRQVKSHQFEDFLNNADDNSKKELDLIGLTGTTTDSDVFNVYDYKNGEEVLESSNRFGDVLFKITLPKGTPVLDLDSEENKVCNAEEKEILLPPMKYKSIDLKEDGINLSDPEPLNIYAIILESLNNMRACTPDLADDIDAIAQYVKTKANEKYKGKVPQECKNVYKPKETDKSLLLGNAPRKNKTLTELIEQESQGDSDFAKNMNFLRYQLGYGKDKKIDRVYRGLHYVSKHEDTHNEDHIDRVIINGTLIAKKEQISDDDFRLLLNALKYHDIGREKIQDDYKDGVSKKHGQYSAETIRKLYEQGLFKGSIKNQKEIDLVCQAITLHSMDDNHLEAIKESDPRLYKISSILKDADNLDRVRLHDLDPKYLRNEHAKTLVPFATTLYQNYTQNKYLAKSANIEK